MQRWVKVPGPGEFRGEGKWKRFEDVSSDPKNWDWLVKTGYVPTKEQDKEPSD